MGIQYGWNTFLGMGRESTFGTAASITNYLRVISGPPKPVFQQDRRPVLGNNIAGWKIGRGLSYVQGDFVTETLYEGMELLWTFLFGNPTIQTDTPIVGANTWTLTPQEEIYTIGGSDYGLTLLWDYDSRAHTFAGCLVEGVSMNITPAVGGMQSTFSIIGQSIADAASSATPTYPADKYPFWNELTFQADVGSGYVAADINSATINLKNNLSNTDRPKLGSGTIRKMVRANYMDITGTINVDYLGDTYYDLWKIAGTPSDTSDSAAIKLKFTFQSSGYYVTGTTKYKFELEFPRVYLEGDTADTNGPGYITQNLNWRAVYDDSSPAAAVTMTLINGASSLPSAS